VAVVISRNSLIHAYGPFKKTVKMKNEKLDEWGYPIHPEYNFEKPEGDFETRIALVIVFSLIIIGIIII